MSLAIIYRDSLAVRRQDIGCISSSGFELQTVIVIGFVQSLDMVNVLRPMHYASTEFYEQFSDLLTCYSSIWPAVPDLRVLQLSGSKP